MVGWYFSASGVYNSHGDGVLGGSGGSRWSAGIFQRQGCIMKDVLFVKIYDRDTLALSHIYN